MFSECFAMICDFSFTFVVSLHLWSPLSDDKRTSLSVLYQLSRNHNEFWVFLTRLKLSH